MSAIYLECMICYPHVSCIDRNRSTTQAKANNLTLDDEIECGRPLGVRWRDGKLYILDAYHGLFELDVKKGGSARHLVSFHVSSSTIFPAGQYSMTYS